MKTRHAAALMILFCISTSPAAQLGRSLPRDAPSGPMPADPVQGGATKDYRVAPPRASHPSPYTDHHYSSSGSYPETTRTHRDPDIRYLPAAPAPDLVSYSREGVRWLCGGIDEQEVSFLKREARRYDMMLTFAARNGAYLVDVDVSLQDPRGRELLHTRCDGPIMLVKVERDGAYRIRAETEGREVTRLVTVQDAQREGLRQHRHVTLTWPSSSTANLYFGPSSSGGSGEEDEGPEIIPD